MQRIERGEIIDTGYEGFFRVRADGKDEISSLPRQVALRVSIMWWSGQVALGMLPAKLLSLSAL